MDPARLFPYEIFEAIIRFTVTGHPGGPLPFLAVSTRWQDTILEIPHVWTCIEIDDDEDTLQRTETFLHLSHLCPLEIQIDLRLQHLESLQPLLRPEVASRIKSLHLCHRSLTTPSTIMRPQLIIDYLERDGTTYPLLEELISGWPFYQSANFLRACTNLRWVIGIPIQSTSLTSLSQEARCIECSLQRLADIEQLRRRKLTSLTLNIIQVSRQIEGRTVFPRLLKASAQQLENLTLRGDLSGHLLSSLFLHPLTRLHTLCVSLPLNLMEFIASSLHLFPRLVMLHLQLTSSQVGQEWPTVPPEVDTEMPRLKNLRITDGSWPADPNRLAFASAFVGRSFLDTVEHLSMTFAHYYHDFSILLPMLEQMSSIRILEVGDSPRSNLFTPILLDEPINQPTPFIMKDLESLKISLGEFMGYVRTPNLQTLEIDDRGRELTTPPKGAAFVMSLSNLSVTSAAFESMDTESLDSDDPDSLSDTHENGLRWMNLSKMTWTSWNDRCATYTASLPSLTTVTLSHLIKSGSLEHSPIDSLCLALLEARTTSKGACPLLHTINSQTYPCWSLLLAVLKNRLDDPNVRPVTTIGLPTLPITPILRLLVDLLGERSKCEEEGRLRTIYRVEDIDSLIQRRLGEFQSLARLSMNKRLNRGFPCSHCLLSGYVRCIDDQETQNLGDSTIASIFDLLDLPHSPYLLDLSMSPESESESTVSQLLPFFHQQISSKRKAITASLEFCRRHGRVNYVPINAFTSVGEYVHMPNYMNPNVSTKIPIE